MKREWQALERAIEALASHDRLGGMRQRILAEPVASSTRPGHEHAAGTVVRMVEPVDTEWWFVEVRVPDDSLVGGASFETLEVAERQLQPMVGRNKSSADGLWTGPSD